MSHSLKQEKITKYFRYFQIVTSSAKGPNEGRTEMSEGEFRGGRSDKVAHEANLKHGKLRFTADQSNGTSRDTRVWQRPWPRGRRRSSGQHPGAYGKTRAKSETGDTCVSSTLRNDATRPAQRSWALLNSEPQTATRKAGAFQGPRAWRPALVSGGGGGREEGSANTWGAQVRGRGGAGVRACACVLPRHVRSLRAGDFHTRATGNHTCSRCPCVDQSLFPKRASRQNGLHFIAIAGKVAGRFSNGPVAGWRVR